eukprot:2025388-Pyramimonas_sp.AAC.1
MRRDGVSRWAAGEGGARFWYKAVRGSSALRAAIARQLQLEVSTIQGFSWAEILWDLEKLYDHLQ